MLNLLLGVFVLLLCIEEIKRKDNLNFDEKNIVIMSVLCLLMMLLPKIMLLILIVYVAISIGKLFTPDGENP
jgi:hypothetical protein